MHFETELNIQNTLFQKNQSAVIKWTEKQLYDNKADLDQKISALIFLFHAGQQKKAFSYIASCFKENKPIPWRVFMIALHNNSVSFPKKFLKNLYSGTLETHNLKNLALVPQSQSWGEEFRKNKEEFYKEQERIKKEQKEKIYDQIDFFRSHKLHEEEKKQLLKAAQLFPQDSRIKQYEKKLKIQWANQIITRNTHKYFPDPLKKKQTSLHEEEKKIIDILFENSQKTVEQTPSKAYDMALFFYFMDQHKYATFLSPQYPRNSRTRLAFL